MKDSELFYLEERRQKEKIFLEFFVFVFLVLLRVFGLLLFCSLGLPPPHPRNKTKRRRRLFLSGILLFSSWWLDGSQVRAGSVPGREESSRRSSEKILEGVTQQSYGCYRSERYSTGAHLRSLVFWRGSTSASSRARRDVDAS